MSDGSDLRPDVPEWIDGDPSLRAELLALLAKGGLTGPEARVLRERAGRRRLLRLRLPDGSDGFVKQYLLGSRHRTREWWKRRLGLTTAEREWRALTRLHAAGVAVPEPLAHVRLASGERVVVTRYLEGVGLGDALALPRAERTRLLAAVGGLVASLHAVGWVHRDLHRENVLVTSAGPVLVDLQMAWPLAGRLADALRRRDLGELDQSLTNRLSLFDRVRLRAFAIAATPPFAPAARARLRAIGEASRACRQTHARSRTQRALRPGRRFARLRIGPWRGLRARDVSEERIRSALAESAAVSPLWVERFSCGWIDALLRGSPARRAWRAGHGLAARGVPTSEPLAFAEHSWLGAAVSSACVRDVPEDAMPTAEAAGALLTALHRADVDHTTLDAGGVEWGPAGPRVTSLEGVRFRRSLADTTRLAAWARLAASLPSEIPADARRRAFLRYASALPFAGGSRAAWERIAPGRAQAEWSVTQQ